MVASLLVQLSEPNLAETPAAETRESTAEEQGCSMLLEVVVPEGCNPGETLSVTYEQGELTVDIPPCVKPGDVLTFTVDAESVPPQDDEFEVTVPEGVRGGETLQVLSPGGVSFDVIVPPCTCSGDMILCRVPLTDCSADRSSDTSCGSSSAVDSEEDGGGDLWRRCAVDRGEDGGAFRYRCGQSVQVLRSDGSFSKATVISAFEGVFEALYEVQLEKCGLVKQAVPENEMYDADDCNDPNFGRCYVDAMAAMMDAEMLEDSWLMNTNDNDGDLYMEAYWGCLE